MAPVHTGAKIVFLNVIYQMFSAQAEQSESARLEHSVKFCEQRLVLFARNMDDCVVRANSVEGIRRESQPGHIPANKFCLWNVFFCQLDLRFRKIHTCDIEMLTQHLADRYARTATSIENFGVCRQSLNEFMEQAHIFRVAGPLRELTIRDGVVTFFGSFLEVHVEIIKQSSLLVTFSEEPICSIFFDKGLKFLAGDFAPIQFSKSWLPDCSLSALFYFAANRNGY